MRTYYSRNGHRIPNPYVDNAQPAPGHTWGTVDGRFVRVLTVVTGDVFRDRYGTHLAVAAWAEGTERAGPVEYAAGPSEAIGRLGKLLSKRLNATPA